MYVIDERIVELLSESSWETPKTMARDSRFCEERADEKYIRQRCRRLVERELIVPVVKDSEMYEITSLGLAYLRGDLDADHLPRWSVG
jgi:hypothetical protein